MWFIEFLLLIIGGALAIPDIVIERLPGASVAMKKMEPYQQWFGLAILIWGIWDLLTALFIGRRAFGMGLLSGFLLLIAILIEICLGLILSMKFIKQIKEIQGKELDILGKTLAKFQVSFGISGIIAGIYVLLRYSILSPLYF
jgi:hypothetical protein